MKREPERVGDVARQWARRVGLDAAVELGIGNDAVWAGIVGDDLAGIGRPVLLREGVLHILARDRHAAARLRYSVDAIRAACNERAGGEPVRVIIVREPRRGSGSGPVAW